jgi:hypothetical protein
MSRQVLQVVDVFAVYMNISMLTNSINLLTDASYNGVAAPVTPEILIASISVINGVWEVSP